MTSKNIAIQRKNHAGKFIDRQPQICAAGLVSVTPSATVADCLQHYLLKDHADAILSDALIPPEKPQKYFQRKPLPLDVRHALYGEAAKLINPPMKSKFETLADDFKETIYSSYWKKPVGRLKDHTSMLPKGFDIYGTTLGIKTTFDEPISELIMPSDRIIGSSDTPPNLLSDRRSSKPLFNRNITFGLKTGADLRGKNVRCCLSDDNVIQGKGFKTVTSTIHADFQEATYPKVGTCLSPNENIKQVPKGHAFGDVDFSEGQDYMYNCNLNPEYSFFKECISHLNSLRRRMSKRYLPTFFRRFYLELKYLDKQKRNWLPKQIVYEECGNRLIRFNPVYIEPCLHLVNAFDGSDIEYQKFLNLINYKEPPPTLPKMENIPKECLHYSTTYRDMVKLGKVVDVEISRAGLPTARYFEMDYPSKPQYGCNADKDSLGDESDARACLNPSILTNSAVSHRDMFAVRGPDVIRKLFEAIGDRFTDEKFNIVWKEAQKHHSKGLVCVETFRRALREIEDKILT